MKAYLYARISRAEDKSVSESIEHQFELLEKFAIENKFIIEQKLFDNNISGTIFDRPALNKILEDAKNAKFQILLAKDLSRLGRNNAKTLMLLDSLEELDIRVITADLRYDSKRDNEITGLETWFNERYVRDISNKTRATIRSLQRQGLALGRAPYGYKKVNKYFFKPDFKQNENVKYIFEEFIRGSSITDIARCLNELDDKKWNNQMIRRIIINPVYIGTLVSGKTERLSFKNKKIIPREDSITTYNHHEAIISKEIFDRANQMLKGVRNRGYDKSGPFKNLLFCKECGKPMYRKRMNKKWGYVCSTYSRYGKDRCTRHYIEEEVLLNKVEEEIKIQFNEKNQLERKREIDLLQEKLEKAYWQYLNGEIDDQLYKYIQNKIELIKDDISSMVKIPKEIFDCVSKIEIDTTQDLKIHLSI